MELYKMTKKISVWTLANRTLQDSSILIIVFRESLFLVKFEAGLEKNPGLAKLCTDLNSPVFFQENSFFLFAGQLERVSNAKLINNDGGL